MARFHEMDDYIRQRNAQADASSNPNALRLKHNVLSDMTEEEKMQIMGLDQVEAQDKAIEGMPWNRGVNTRTSRNVRGRGLIDTADNVDHAANGNMYPVKNQGGCGSCWAFSATSTLEGTIAAKTGQSPVRISEQQQVDCNNNTYGCQGGWMSYVYSHWSQRGAVAYDDYPYTGSDDNCVEDSKPKYFDSGNVKEWVQLDQDVAQIKQRLMQQPMSIAIHASSRDFQMYSSGVYDGGDCDPNWLDHAVVLVGYQDPGDDSNDGGDGGDDSSPSPSPTPEPQPPSEEHTVDKWWWYQSAPQNDSRRLQRTNSTDRYWKI